MRKFGESEEAVSPVIGVTSMLGLTVIMVSIVSLSVFSFALPESAPQAKIMIVEAKGDMTANLKENVIVLKHKGGDALFENDTKIIITGRGCAYYTGTMEASCFLGNMRATYSDLAGENYILEYDGEIVEGTSWDAGETITLYGSDGIHPFGNRHNTVDSKWKLDDGSTVSITIIDITTNQVIAVSRATVKKT